MNTFAKNKMKNITNKAVNKLMKRVKFLSKSDTSTDKEKGVQFNEPK
jgi:hypothetical protein